MSDARERLRAALAERYAIERELGAGGMATVYLAEDLRHHRHVALKVLKPEIAATLGAGRFAREIEVAARLQHPNILPLLDSGEADGFLFYVMPYVEGESLRDRLGRGGELPIPEAVRILTEVADALNEAHTHGVVHRDIKPDNVMLRGRHALVTDFGVAKAVTAATGYQLLTSAGVALGTPTYMAPEQATADPHQDHRVDIYALGVLGYELLTGRPPYSAITAQEMLAAHVTATPEPLEKYRAAVSPALAAVILKCLAKKPADRWQTAEELVQHLEPLATPSGGITPTQTRPILAFAALPRWTRWTAAVAGVAVAALIVALALRSRPLTVTASDFTQVTNDPGIEFEPALSPDGSAVAYVAGGPVGAAHLFVRAAANFATGAAVRLGDTTTGSEWVPSWTPDGQRVRFLGCPLRDIDFRHCRWKEVGRFGGPVQVLGPKNWSTVWSADGARLAYLRADSIFTSAVADTAGRHIGSVGKENWGLFSPAWSPDGKWIAFANGNQAWVWSGNVFGSSLWIVSSAGGTPVRLAGKDQLNASPAWLDDTHLLFVSDRDGQRAAYVAEVGPHGLRGAPRIVPGIEQPHSISYSIAARKLAWARFTLRQNIRSYPLVGPTPTSIRNGTPVTTGNQVIENQDVSRDGHWIVYGAYLRGRLHLYKISTGGREPIPLTSGFDEEIPSWSPDGREIAFNYYADEHANPQVAVVPAEGGAPVPLTSGPSESWYPRWSPDGLHIVFNSSRARPPGRSGWWILSRDSVGGSWHDARPVGDSTLWCPEWAPDGALACVAPGDSLLFVSARDGRILRRVLLAARGLSDIAIGIVRFSRDGRFLYAQARGKDGRTGIWAMPTAGGAARLAVAFDDPAVAGSWWLSVGPDRLYLTVSEYDSDIWVATLKW